MHSRKGDKLAKAMKRNSRIQWPVSFSLECSGKAETCRWSEGTAESFGGDRSRNKC